MWEVCRLPRVILAFRVLKKYRKFIQLFLSGSGKSLGPGFARQFPVENSCALIMFQEMFWIVTLSEYHNATLQVCRAYLAGYSRALKCSRKSFGLLLFLNIIVQPFSSAGSGWETPSLESFRMLMYFVLLLCLKSIMQPSCSTEHYPVGNSREFEIQTSNFVPALLLLYSALQSSGREF